MVEVEPNNIVPGITEGEYHLKPYSQRRGEWGKTLSLTYSTFDPIHYGTAFNAGLFDQVYGVPTMPLLELYFGVKRNLAWGSLGGELAAGAYENQSSEPTIVNSTLNLYPVRLGVTLALDAISREPWFVPYVSGGLYEIFFKESLAGSSFHGNTQAAPYIHGGIALCLDWIDRHAARIAYRDSGIESSFLLLEARKQFASTVNRDPDFSNDVSFAAGLRVEF